MDKLDMESKNIVSSNIEKIKKLFPNVITEDNGKEVINFDALKQELSEVIIDEKKEKYQLTWPGKKQAIVNANSPISKTLRPLKDKSVNFDSTKNIYIEGDNLDALKLLQESYLNKIKCIYIDPPYNTGNDFIYNDNYNKTNSQELLDSGIIDENGNILSKQFGINNSFNGRYHSDWLTMMYSRLKLARNLLTNDGFIFISIDDNELFNLKKICDEIFGENNFINNISIKMSELSGVKMKNLNRYPKLKESLLIYSKNFNSANLFIEKKQKSKESLANYLKYYSNVIMNKNESIEKWKIVSINEYFKIKNINVANEEIDSWKLENSDIMVYRTNSRTVEKYIQNNPGCPNIAKIVNNDGNDIYKWDDKEMLFLSKYVDESLGDIWMDISTINLNKETDVVIYENGQKPLKLLERIIKSVINDNDIVLDFFSGSATTAHAVMKVNKEENKNVRFIMVQIPDLCNEKSEAYKSGYKTLCDIGEARIRKGGEKICDNNIANIDCGFRVYNIDSSNMKDVFYKPNEVEQTNLFDYMTNVKEDRTPEDLLTQVILDLGLTLDLPIEEKTINNNKVYYVAENALVACFDDLIDINIIDIICECQPLKVVFKDSSFRTDKDKINLEERVKKISPETKISIL